MQNFLNNIIRYKTVKRMITTPARQHNWPLVVFIAWWLFLWSSGVFTLMGPHLAVAGETALAPEERSMDLVADYLIGAGDVLEILVWKEPDISKTVRVRPDGKISLPLVDDIQASQSTLLELKKRISDALAPYVDHSSVYVMLQENRSKKIYIVGNVNAPGGLLNGPTKMMSSLCERVAGCRFGSNLITIAWFQEKASSKIFY